MNNQNYNILKKVIRLNWSLYMAVVGLEKLFLSENFSKISLFFTIQECRRLK